MSRPDAINLTRSNIVSDTPTGPSKAEVEAYAHRMVQVLSRGSIVDKFKVKAPNGTHYEWHPDNASTHARLTSKGFIADDDLGRTSEFIHTDGSGNPRIADTRCYSIPKWQHDIIQRIEAENSARSLDPRRATRDFLKTLNLEGGFEGDSTFGESSDQKVTGLEIDALLKTT